MEKIEFDKYKLEIRSECLALGREIRHKQLIEFRESIPKIKDILENNSLNFEKWFKSYQNMINFGSRKILSISKKENLLEIVYRNNAKGVSKTFKTNFPCKIPIDQDFQYFFGLWIGDKAGGGRFGVMNKEKSIIFFVRSYLEKLYQKPEMVLHVHSENLPNLEYNYDKLVRINSIRNGYAISTHSINGIFKSFFKYLEQDLDLFLDLIPNKSIFFAGLFDAEGNVFLEDSCFRWSSNNKINIPIFIKHLKSLDLFKRFDGSNLVTNNKNIFSDNILPYIKHPSKINDAKLVCYGEGFLNERFKTILRHICLNPGISSKQTAQALKRVKVSSQILFLNKHKYIERRGYPFKMYITTKGAASLSPGGKDL
ncbi:MAG TPA: hypothetical protein VJB90_00625 [Candidatus Nanoarchaeia archaeon]|nr:hypothetical protein [Candidatus Nanoarchaeia archaeon]